MKKIFAANWKLYKTPQQARDFFAAFNSKIEQLQLSSAQTEIVVFPSAFALEATILAAKQNAKIGAQNCYIKGEGAFTGENSAQVAKDLGASYILVGHSERRALFAEQDIFLADKVAYVQSLGLTAMLCIGETLEQRESNKTNAVLFEQLRLGLSKAQKNLVVAYEPVWAIGTGKVATTEQVAETHAAVAQMLSDLGFSGTPILYGGSVKPDNAAGLIQQKNVSGFLIGGASLEADSFLKIIELAK